MTGYLCALLPPFLAANAVIGCLLRGETCKFSRLLLQFGLATVLALGISSACFWGWLIAFGGPSKAYFITEISVNLLIAAIVAIWTRRTKQSFHPTETASTRPSIILAGCTAILAIVAGLTLHSYADANPNGGWDAWDNWNCKARFIYRAPASWGAVATDHFELPDYPPLLPMANARIWTWLGSDPPWASCLTNILFTAAVATMLAGAVGILRSANQGMLALLLFLGWDKLLFWCSAQYADLPLASLMLAAVVCVLLSRREALDQPATEFAWLFLGGLFTSMAACMKNEGLVFAAIYMVASGAISFRHFGLKQTAQRTSILCAGSATGLIALAWFKLSLAPATHLLAAQGVSTFQRISDVNRHAIIIAEAWRQIQSHGVLLLLVLPAIFIAWGRSRSQTSAVRLVVAVLLLMTGFYYAAYLVSPYELRWHVVNSIDRLALQLWPLGVLAFCLECKSPTEVLAEASHLPDPSSAATTT